MKLIAFIALFFWMHSSHDYLASTASSVQTPIISEESILFTGANSKQLKVSAYGDEILRLQSANAGTDFYADDHYEMVESHNWRTPLTLESTEQYWQLSPKNNNQLQLRVTKQTLQATFINNGKVTLSEIKSPQKTGTTIKVQFKHHEDEHFTGLGHGFYGRESSLDLKGQRTGRNYGAKPIEQAPLLVPFYLSSKGYGVFLNSTFTNEFSFGDQDEYSISIDDHGFGGQMDYFYIAGDKLTRVLDNYTQLTGRPRLPAKAMFGLQLSDKGHDHNSSTPSDEAWWKNKITEHRNAGYPLDHIVNDNRWRAAGGKRCESKLDWDSERYPDPEQYQQWVQKMGLVMTLDFNRCIAVKSDGWQTSFNLPDIKNIQFSDSAPDLTNHEFRTWFWQIFYNKSLDPSKRFPGDALWIDEFDEQGGAPKDIVLSNGRSSAEMRNYWFFLVAKALVADGWDKSDLSKRPFVWVRGMTAGAQRYATLWSGDIYPNNLDMQYQVRAMQLAGLSGFPFWGHDAGGFYDWKANIGPDEDLYQRWAIALGSFSPIWKPHGMGQSRWPLDRSSASQQLFHTYARHRYELMPYTYSMAHQASSTGLPIVRAMILDYQAEEKAWQYDLQYLWGDSILVVPQTTNQDKVDIWLPAGQWYRYGQTSIIDGDQVITSRPNNQSLSLFVKAGAIIPKRQYAKSTQFINKDKLILDVYPGSDSTFILIEDDDATEAYKEDNQRRLTSIEYHHKDIKLIINASQGSYANASENRETTVRFYGGKDITSVTVNGKTQPHSVRNGIIEVVIDEHPVAKTLMIEMLSD